jgi:hypothetical protein
LLFFPWYFFFFEDGLWVCMWVYICSIHLPSLPL